MNTNQNGSRRVTRRGFLKAAGIALGASTVACCGLSIAAMPKSPAGQQAQVETPSYSFGENDTMNKRILVAYATRTGSTVGVAAAIGETLAARGFAVDVKPLNGLVTLDDYQGVVIGSAVQGGKWLPEAVEFATAHQQDLTRMPVALFCVHIMNLGDDERSRANRLAYLDDVRSLVNPAGEGFFAGVGMDPGEQSALVRWIYRAFNIGGEGDCRDWEKIHAWAERVFA